MPIEKLERWSGVAAALGGALFVYIFITDSGASDFTRILLFLLPLLAMWALALTGLYRRLPARSQPGKRLAFGLGLLSILFIAAGVLVLDLTESDFGWYLLILGFYGLTGGIAGLGIVALRHGSLGLWRPVPLLLAAFFVGFLASGNEYDTLDNPVQLTFIILAGIGWVALGMALWGGEARTAEPGLPA